MANEVISNEVILAKATEFFNNFKENKRHYGLRDYSCYRSGTLAYLDPATGEVYLARTSFYQHYNSSAEIRENGVKFVTLKEYERGYDDISTTILINPEEAFNYIKANRPTEYKWIMAPFKSENFTRKLVTRLRFAVVWPELVQLNILDYKFTKPLLDVTITWDSSMYEIVDKYYGRWSHHEENSSSRRDFWNKCRGNGPKEILYPIPEKMIKTLKDAHIQDIMKLRDIYAGYNMERVAENKDRVVQIINALHLNTYEEIIRSEFNDPSFWAVITSKHNGKPIFTLQSLLTYLERLDTFQAIDRGPALSLLRDYINMCNALGIAPKKDTNSLKREHDVVARNYRMRRDEATNNQIKEVNKQISKFNYADKKSGMFIRAIVDYDDLRNEGIKMDNCVGSYAKRIAEGYSYIFVLRSINHPEDSIITIELNPSTLGVVQKYLSHNRTITNEAQLNLINEWHRHCLKVRSGSVNTARYEKEVYNIVHGIVEEEFDVTTQRATENLIKEFEAITPDYDVSAEEKVLSSSAFPSVEVVKVSKDIIKAAIKDTRKRQMAVAG